LGRALSQDHYIKVSRVYSCADESSQVIGEINRKFACVRVAVVEALDHDGRKEAFKEDYLPAPLVFITSSCRSASGSADTALSSSYQILQET
jgi:hypothetical protein